MKVFDRLERRRNWSVDEHLILDQVQRLADEVIARAAEHYDHTKEFPHANVAAINELGLNALFVPRLMAAFPARSACTSRSWAS